MHISLKCTAVSQIHTASSGWDWNITLKSYTRSPLNIVKLLLRKWTLDFVVKILILDTVSVAVGAWGMEFKSHSAPQDSISFPKSVIF